jgi:hypothetical protein
MVEKAECESRSKKRRRGFSRERETPRKEPARFTPSVAKESSQNALERFFPKLKEAARASRRAFSHARRRIKREACRELFHASARRAAMKP